jgi:hypothetical protein
MGTQFQQMTNTLIQEVRDTQRELPREIYRDLNREDIRPNFLPATNEDSHGQAPLRRSLPIRHDILVQTSHRARAACELGCTCSCHRRGGFRTPSFLNRVLGSLFIGYSGLPLVSRSCDQSLCRRQGRYTSTTFSYYFPGWFMLRSVYMTIKNSPLRGPEAHLNVSRVVWDQAEIFWHSINGNIDGIKALFDAGLASPNDVAFEDNYSPLLVSSSALTNRTWAPLKLMC